ncbi:MAG: S1 RNA-binding domain-containing protein, partial [Acidaminococcaceae bacterium]
MTENEKIVNEENAEEQAQTPVAADETKKEETPVAETPEAEAQTATETEAKPEVEAEVKAEEKTEVKTEVEAPAETETVAEKAEEKPAQKEKVKPTVPEDFDWDNIGKKREVYSKSDREKLEQLYDKTLSSIGDHEVIDGIVVSKNSREVVVNIGFKSDGVIPVNEFRYNPNLKVGDKVEVYVENQE